MSKDNTGNTKLQVAFARVIELDSKLAEAVLRLTEQAAKLTQADAELAVLYDMLDILKDLTAPGGDYLFKTKEEYMSQLHDIVQALLEMENENGRE